MRLTHHLVTRLAVLGLATVLLCMGGFGVLQAARTNDAGNRTAQASEVADAFAGARLALAGEEAVKYEYQLEPSSGLHGEFLTDVVAVSRSLADAARLMPASQRAATNALISLHELYTAAVQQMFAAVNARHPGRALSIDKRVADPMNVRLASGVEQAADRAGALAAGRVAGVRALQGQSATAAPIATVIGLVLLAFFVMVLIRTGRREAIQDVEIQVLDRAAAHDPLTGLANRRKLTIDLEDALASATDEQPTALLMFDLDGFKSYNDSFGHPAGDELLVRLALKLSIAVAELGEAYRLGGDEFCVLIPAQSGDLTEIGRRLSDALHERGEGFDISCSLGLALLPQDAPDAATAMLLADQRLYATKNRRRVPSAQQGIDVLTASLAERDPELNLHSNDVTELVLATARTLHVEGPELERLRHAAALHDIGKIAIPDAILHKPGKLDAQEWKLMRGHTLIGQRILAAAPELTDVGELVRATHEHYDGNGYPDGLARQDIPLGARIIAAADAYDAMTTSRAYADARTPAQAITELRRCSGAQFDPDVIDALCSVLTAVTLTPA